MGAAWSPAYLESWLLRFRNTPSRSLSPFCVGSLNLPVIQHRHRPGNLCLLTLTTTARSDAGLAEGRPKTSTRAQAAWLMQPACGQRLQRSPRPPLRSRTDGGRRTTPDTTPRCRPMVPIGSVAAGTRAQATYLPFPAPSSENQPAQSPIGETHHPQTHRPQHRCSCRREEALTEASAVQLPREIIKPRSRSAGPLSEQ